MTRARSPGRAARFLAAFPLIGFLALTAFSVTRGILHPQLSQSYREIITILLAFHFLILFPLSLPLLSESDRRGRANFSLRISLYLLPLGALTGTLSFFFPAGGVPAVLLSAPWALYTLLLALGGLGNLLSRGQRPPGAGRFSETCLDFGLLYLGVGGAWFFIHRAGIRPLGFDETIVILTAVHFHYAGFAAHLIVGLGGRLLGRCANTGPAALYPFFSALVMLGPLAVAAAITASRFGYSFEHYAAGIFALGLGGASALQLMYGTSRQGSVVGRVIFVVSQLSIWPGLALALLYSLGLLPEPIAGLWKPDIPFMVRWHGIGNALGYAFFGVFAYLLLGPRSVLNPSGTPFSALFARGRIRPDFFSRNHCTDSGAPPARGIVDDMNAFSRPDFDPARLPASVRSFYENTGAYELMIEARWTRGFKTLGRLYKLLSSFLGQMNFPPEKKGERESEGKMSSLLEPLREDRDGRKSPRSWVRTYADSGRNIYAAAYALHECAGETFMNIAFPIPGGNITSILRLEYDDSGALVLTTFSGKTRKPGDEGIFWVLPFLPVRVPLDETIRVYEGKNARADKKKQFSLPAKARDEIFADHDMYILGIPFLRLEYAIFKSDGKK